jgi:hypothetical protein
MANANGDKRRVTAHSSKHPLVTDEVLAEICREADVIPASALRRICGLPVRGRVGRRIDAALAKRGIVPVPDDASSDAADDEDDDVEAGADRAEPASSPGGDHRLTRPEGDAIAAGAA